MASSIQGTGFCQNIPYCEMYLPSFLWNISAFQLSRAILSSFFSIESSSCFPIEPSSELQDKLNEFDVFDKLNTFEGFLLFLKKHPYYGSRPGRDGYFALTYYILEDYRKSMFFLDKIISLRKREDYNLFLDKIENARLLKDYIERGDYDKGVSQILEWQEQTMNGIKL